MVNEGHEDDGNEEDWRAEKEEEDSVAAPLKSSLKVAFCISSSLFVFFCQLRLKIDFLLYIQECFILFLFFSFSLPSFLPFLAPSPFSPSVLPSSLLPSHHLHPSGPGNGETAF